jgi:hypothetical protein
MTKKITILLIVFCVCVVSCGALQLKWDKKVQKHMETLLTNPDEVVMNIIEEWNAQDNLKPGQSVDLELVQENITSMEFDNKKGHCRVYLKHGLDFDTQRKVVGQAMVVFGSLYWMFPEQKRSTVYLFGNIDETENFVFSWKRGEEQPVIDRDRTMSYV